MQQDALNDIRASTIMGSRRPTTVKLEDFEIKMQLGKGTFGRVSLLSCQHQDNSTLSKLFERMFLSNTTKSQVHSLRRTSSLQRIIPSLQEWNISSRVRLDYTS